MNRLRHGPSSQLASCFPGDQSTHTVAKEGEGPVELRLHRVNDGIDDDGKTANRLFSNPVFSPGQLNSTQRYLGSQQWRPGRVDRGPATRVRKTKQAAMRSRQLRHGV